MTNVDSIKIESDERGFELHLTVDEEPWVDDNGRLVLNIHGVAIELLREVQRTIGPWLAEGEKVRHAFLCTPDESAGYDTSDPKHPEFHSIHADIWDAREGK